MLENQVNELYKYALRQEEHDVPIAEVSDSSSMDKKKITVSTKSFKHYPKVKEEKDRKHKTTFDTLKFGTPILMELNTIDSATLTKIPGIGAKTAATIIRYREQLGGFASPYQIAEKLQWDGAKERMDEWCTQWLKADSKLIRKLNVNTADFKQILRHPYISYEQTKALVSYRDKHKRIEGFDALEMIEEFSEDDIERLKMYLEF